MTSSCCASTKGVCSAFAAGSRNSGCQISCYLLGAAHLRLPIRGSAETASAVTDQAASTMMEANAPTRAMMPRWRLMRLSAALFSFSRKSSQPIRTHVHGPLIWSAYTPDRSTVSGPSKLLLSLISLVSVLFSVA
jgi:hypothetical protein